MKVWAILAAFTVLLLDQLSKALVMAHLASLPMPRHELTSYFNLVEVWNYGVSFGMFSGHKTEAKWALIAVAFIIIAGLLWWLRKVSARYTQLAIGLIIGGAIGNVIDRLRFGAVYDFLDFHLYDQHWPAFNVADSAICVGVILLLCEGWLVKPGADSQPSKET